ncbi:MAG: histidine--tRNA ligase [Candidatus Pacebacteria bacterium]|nr:histidine--tRNA ligase [Candidatus Paceibacterota bacterium]MDD2757165.1 histidine--tRNA ligase [Candidatus Paceibacterota bacterium]MDD3283663.1 histidine--tRNA ligase [Candidatus Paceibacterota bacterium]MDD3969713.1 histidine--tRNA ligase [Candidatus Paceibacterota bacterium]MDD4737691.1 histidine--tRNA ligase [Candidatus Paceibacterota bacterium]
MSKPKFQSPTGMHDILPQSQAYHDKIYNIVKNIVSFYDFEKIDTPILEDFNLFVRSIGESTDIVEKEMFTLKTKGKDHLALRPEGTAPIMRAYIENGFLSLPQPVRLWYFGPFFRYEKPQAGRFRQFHQFGIEIIGESDPIVDVQSILIMYKILQDLGLKDVIVKINSIGDDKCRPTYRKDLIKYLRSNKSSLCSDCEKRIKTNPLRVLDCKNEKCQQVLLEAPQSVDYLCEECKKHLKDTLEYLDELKIPYSLESKLVRGLDYYTRNVFEIESTISGVVLAGGGRYDNLAKVLGGGEISACGAAAGIERIINEMKQVKSRPILREVPDTFFTQIGPLAKKRSLPILEELRKAGLMIGESFGKNGLKDQLGKASRLGVKAVIILGQKEAINGTILIRSMKTSKQVEVRQEDIVKELKKILKEN